MVYRQQTTTCSAACLCLHRGSWDTHEDVPAGSASSAPSVRSLARSQHLAAALFRRGVERGPVRCLSSSVLCWPTSCSTPHPRGCRATPLSLRLRTIHRQRMCMAQCVLVGWAGLLLCKPATRFCMCAVKLTGVAVVVVRRARRLPPRRARSRACAGISSQVIPLLAHPCFPHIFAPRFSITWCASPFISCCVAILHLSGAFIRSPCAIPIPLDVQTNATLCKRAPQPCLNTGWPAGGRSTCLL